MEYHWPSGQEPASDAEIEALFHEPRIQRLKEIVCELGRRMWEKDFVDGNGGNLSVRVGDDLLLCTPTMISKGFMRPDDLCLVDFNGRQRAGRRRPTSEISTHISLMRHQPAAKACVHAHPPHATAYALVAGGGPPPLLTEAEIFLGELGIAEYFVPGSPEIGEAVGRLAERHVCILMKNHGVITWSRDLEDAYWKIEIVDAACRTAWLASQLGRPLCPFTPEEQQVLRAIGPQLGRRPSGDSD